MQLQAIIDSYISRGFTPSENMKVSRDDYSQYMENKSHGPNHQPISHYFERERGTVSHCESAFFWFLLQYVIGANSFYTLLYIVISDVPAKTKQ